LKRLGDEMFVKVRQRRVQLAQYVRRILISVRISPVIPGAGAENAPFGFLAQDRSVADVPVTV